MSNKLAANPVSLDLQADVGTSADTRPEAERGVVGAGSLPHSLPFPNPHDLPASSSFKPTEEVKGSEFLPLPSSYDHEKRSHILFILHKHVLNKT